MKGLSFIKENQSLHFENMFGMRNFKNINWERLEFDEGKSNFLPFSVVYHILGETEI